jgi:hypothetical protein
MPRVEEGLVEWVPPWEPIELPQALLDSLVECLLAPADRAKADRRQQAIGRLTLLFNVAIPWKQFDDAEARRKKARKELGLLAKTALKLQSQMRTLSEHAKVQLSLGDYRRNRELHAAVDRIVDRVQAASAFDFWEGARKTKDPFGPRGSAFEQWIHMVWWTQFEDGWTLTVSASNDSRNNQDKEDKGTGTVIRFLELAEPYLPAGFVPKPYSLDRIRRIRDDVRAHRDEVRTRLAAEART